MKIKRMEIIPVAHRTPPLRTSWGTYPEFASRTIIRLTTGDGTIGVGETHGSPQVIDALERARSLVEGCSPFDRTEFQLRLGNAPAYGAIEMAMLDIIGKVVGEPVSVLLGGRLRESIEYSAYLFYKDTDRKSESDSVAPGAVDSPATLVKEACAFADEFGFGTFKLKGGVLEPGEEVETLRLLAEEFGSDAPLRIDPNGNWSVETTIQVASRLRELDANVQFLEDPAPTLNAHRRLRNSVDYPVATNMFVTSLDDVAPAVHANAVDIVLGEYHYCDGLTGVMQLDALAQAFDLGTGVHSTPHLGVSLAAMTHLGAAMKSNRYASDTHYPWFHDDVVASPPEFEDGRLNVPHDPGLGVELDEERVNRLHQLYHDTDPLSFSNISTLGTKLASAGDGPADLTRPRW